MKSTHEDLTAFSVIFDRIEFQAAVREVLMGRIGIAAIDRRSTVESEELILRRWNLSDQLPRIADRSPFYQGAVLVQSGMYRIKDPILAPTPGQTLLIICVDSIRVDDLYMVILDSGKCYSVNEVRLIGSKLVTVLTVPISNSATREQEIDVRSSRLRSVVDGKFEQIKQSSVVVVGAGSGGSELSRQLAALEVGMLTIVDDDVVGMENLNNMPFAGPRDMQSKRRKVEALVGSIHRNQPDLPLVGLPYRIQDYQAVQHVMKHRYDTMFVFADNPAASIAASIIARETLTVCIAVGTRIEIDADGKRQSRCDIRLFEPNRGCPVCAPTMDRAEYEDALYEVHRPRGMMQRGKPQRWDASRPGSLLAVNSLACSLAVDLWLRYMAGSVRTSHWIRVDWPSGRAPVIQEASIAAGTQCPICDVR